MITHSELRTGNILRKEGLIVTIDGRSIMDIQFVTGYAEKYDPISLTEDCMLKLGFESVYGDWFRLILPKNTFLVNIVDEVFGVQDEHESVTACRHMKYIHQLQNAFYFLTGKELKKININPW